MKRNLFENVRVQPYTSGEAIGKSGFLSGILGVKVGTAGKLTLTVTHGDTDAASDAVTDEYVFPEARTAGGVFEIDNLAKDAIVDIDIDLLGLKKYIKITLSGTAATNSVCAFALGDAYEMPI